MNSSIENTLEDARDSVSDLRKSIENAIEALEELEGSISDAESIEGLTLNWAHGSPEVYEILSNIALRSAEFSHTETL